ncbi:helix-turn-helix transcriptional regulator [Spirochaetes bacterium]|uniref:Helix-turn-helix transcriptional regulator n=1 Tax=Candidatus Scatousia excrementipullorum TaxID=2840936 RepID=A0A9D9DRH1_9BACT|nr:helix-turn-helix transcriptional regulator [Candidatus Scatousia excrementipullorum]
MNLKKCFGQNVQKYRKYRNLTQEKLAELVGVDVTSISAVETGKYFPSADNLARIVEVLQVQFSDLFEFDSLMANEEMFNDIVEMLTSFKGDKKRLNAVRNFVKTLI